MCCLFPGLFNSDVGTTARKFNTEITPAGWAFSIWGVIYIWQALWIIYAIASIFRKTEKGPRYRDPVLLSIPLLVCYLLNQGLNVTWMFTWDRHFIEVAAGVLCAMVVTLYVCLFCSYRSLANAKVTLIKQGRGSDIWMTRILVQNGLGTYAAWCTIATLLNFATALIYRTSGAISQQDGCSIALGILAAVFVLYALKDWFLTDKWTRYTVTPYVVLVYALTASVAKNYEAGARNTVLTIVLLAIGILAMVVKFGLMFARHCKETRNAPNENEENKV